MESSPINVFRSSLLLLLLLELVHWIAHVCQRKPQKNHRTSVYLLWHLWETELLCAPWSLNMPYQDKKQTQKHNSQWLLWWMSLWGLSPRMSAETAQGAAVGEPPAPYLGPACSARSKKECLCPLLCCDSHKSAGKTFSIWEKRVNPCAWIQAPVSTQGPPHNASD